MRLTHFFLKTFCVVFAFSIQLCSCVDEKYDLNRDIELKVSFSDNGLILPESNSAAIELEQIIELNENGQLITDEDGNYMFYKLGNDLTPTTMTLGQGSLCNAVEENYIYHFREDPTLETTIKSDKYNTATMTFSTGVSPQYQPDRITSGVREFEYITSPLRIDIDIMFENMSEFASAISEIRYQIPSFYDLTDEGELVERNVSTRGQHRHTINTKGVNFKAALRDGEALGYNPETGEITMRGEVKMYCKVNTAHMDEYEALDDPRLRIRITVGTLGTNEVRGRFYQKEQINIDPITFDDLPDVVSDDEVVIDIENPVVRLTVDNEVPAGAFVNATMKSVRNGVETAQLQIGDENGTAPIYFGPDAIETVWLSREKMEIPDSVRENVVIDNIMTLLKKMPDEITVDGWAHTDSSTAVTIGLNRDYTVRPRYELAVPLKIGKNMKLVYKKDMDNLHSKLKNIDVEQFRMKATAKNNIPLDLEMEITPRDAAGNIINGIVLEQSQKIKAMGNTDVELTLYGCPADFSELETIELKAYATSNEKMAGQQLNKKQALMMENVKVTVK